MFSGTPHANRLIYKRIFLSEQIPIPRMADSSPVAGSELRIDPILEFPSCPIGPCFCWVNLKLAAPEGYDEDRARPTTDIVLVIDRSGSMNGDKFRLVKHSVNFILSQLDMRDRLAVVVFDSTAQTIFPFTHVTPSMRDMLYVKIESISIGNSTNLCEGIQTGIKLLIERETSSQVSSLLLFSDGLPTVGVTQKDAILNAMHNPCNQPLVRHLPSTSLKRNTLYSVNTFGIGTDHDPRMLQAISQAGGGIFHSLFELTNIRSTISNCFGGLLSTYAQQISIKLFTNNDAELKILKVRENPELSEDCKEANVEIVDIQLGEVRDILLNLQLPIHLSESNEICYATLKISYELSDTLKLINTEVRVVVRRSAETVARSRANKEVSIQRSRWRTVQAMREAREKASSGELEEAIKILKRCKSSLYDSSTADGALSKLLLEDLDRIIRELRDQTYLTTSGCSLLTASMDSHSLQRSTSHNTECYATKSRDNMLTESDRFTKSINFNL